VNELATQFSVTDMRTVRSHTLVNWIQTSGIEEYMCFYGPVRFGWKVGDKPNASSPVEVATKGISYGTGQDTAKRWNDENKHTAVFRSQSIDSE